MRDVRELTNLALADCAVLVAGVAQPPLTEREKLCIRHVVTLMDAICTNIHSENTRLIARLAECREDGGEPPGEMAVSA